MHQLCMKLKKETKKLLPERAVVTYRRFAIVVMNLIEKFYLIRDKRAEPGTMKWLVKTEVKYGGFVSGMPVNKVSTKDPRSLETLRRSAKTGGDRMSDLHHGYARHYAS
jgi:hypothetical protein